MIIYKKALFWCAILVFGSSQIQSKCPDEGLGENYFSSEVKVNPENSSGNSYCSFGLELIQFTGEALVNGNVLRWITASEKMNFNYTIERSFDGLSYRDIGQMESVSSAEYVNTYSIVDKTAANEPMYYRLKQSALNGEHVYSDEVLINRSEEMGVTHFQMKTKKESETLDIEYDQLYKDRVVINLYDKFGKKVFHKTLPSIDGHNIHRVDLSRLDIGMYEFDISRKDGSRLYRSFFVKDE